MMSKAWLDVFSKREKEMAIHKPLLFPLFEKHVQRKVCIALRLFSIWTSCISHLDKMLIIESNFRNCFKNWAPCWEGMKRLIVIWKQRNSICETKPTVSRSTLLQRSWKVCFCSSSSTANMQALQSILSIPIIEITEFLLSGLFPPPQSMHPALAVATDSLQPTSQNQFAPSALSIAIRNHGTSGSSRDFFCPTGSVGDEVPLG